MSLIVHLDVDAFGASVVRVLNPRLRGRPIVVGHEVGGRGLVSCASYEARSLGARAGMPLAVVRRRVPGAVIVSPAPAEEFRLSTQLFAVSADAAPVAEATTIDDIYLDITGCYELFGRDLLRWSQRLARNIRSETGLPVSMGVGSSKFVARVATWAAKTGRVASVVPGQEQEFVAAAPVHLLPGAGDMLCERLNEYGVQTVGQLIALGEERFCMLFGLTAKRLWDIASCRYHDPVRATRRHGYVTHEYRLDEDTTDPLILSAIASRLVQRIIWDLRRRGFYCDAGELLVTYSDDGTASRALALESPTCNERTLGALAQSALQKACSRRVRVRKLLLRARYKPSLLVQGDFFDDDCVRKDRSLARAIDEVHERHGINTLSPATCLIPRPNP
ncbi:MAG: hypothetical protein K1X53_13700 [Candidatus Sumerlaeaceae bacterium]|nr:hypothetical protein [Candidatus Sumerlaeaceae bacterium]